MTIKSEMGIDGDMGGCSSAEPFALQVLDNSMEPEFKKGCLIIIDPEGIATDGAYVFATDPSGHIFRKLIIENEKYYIVPLHEDYMHEKREVAFNDIKGVIVSQSGTKGKRSERKKYD